jgi:hypothetical protein
MTNTQSGKFACPTCGHQFAWREALAGRQVRCTCGAVFRCPSEVEADETDYELAPQAVAPLPATAVPQGARVVKPAGMAAAGGGLQARRSVARGAQKEGLDVDKIKSFYAPLWMLCGGIVVELIVVLIRSEVGFGAAALGVGLPLLATTGLGFAAVALAAKVRQFELGSYASAALRLAAICVAAQAVMDLLRPVLNFVGHFAAVGMISLGSLVAGAVQFILYFALLGALFDLDQEDTWYCVCIMFVISVGLRFAMMAMHVQGATI